MKTPKGYDKWRVKGGHYIFSYVVIGSDIIDDDFKIGICLN